MSLYQSAVQSAIEWSKNLIRRRSEGEPITQEQIDESVRRAQAFIYIEKELKKVVLVDLSALDLGTWDE